MANHPAPEVIELGAATTSGNPERIHRARQAYNAHTLEKALNKHLNDGHGVADEDRARLAHLLLTGGAE